MRCSRAHPLRRLRQAGQRRRAARAARRGRRARGRSESRPAGLRGDRARSARGLMAAPVALVVLDGFGCAPEGPGNAVRLARTPVFDALWERWPHTTLSAAGRAVGLPDGQMGNSEVGHLNIGAGRVVAQDLVRLGDAVDAGRLLDTPALLAAP